MSKFIWKGFQFRNLLPLETICQPVESGGLGIPYLRSKCDSLLLKQMLRMIVTSRNSFNHITFWLGSVLKIPGLTDFIHFTIDRRGRKKESMPSIFSYMSDLFSEALDSQRFNMESLQEVTTKSLYLSFTETMPPPSVELSYPDRNFRLVWKRVSNCVLSKDGRTILYLIIHGRSWTKERGFRLIQNRYDSPLCPKCHIFIHDISHKYTKCSWLNSAWDFIREIMLNLEPVLMYESDYNILNLIYPQSSRENALVWLLGQYLEFVEIEVMIKNRRISRNHIRGWLQAKYAESQHASIPFIGSIYGLFPMGIG